MARQDSDRLLADEFSHLLGEPVFTVEERESIAAYERISKRNRQSKYHKSLDKLVHQLALLGQTDKQIAKTVGIDVKTLRDWKARYPEFNDALQSGREPADASVAFSLFQRARGITLRAERILQDGTVVPYKVQIPGDPKAAAVWLANRSREKWGNQNKTEITGANGEPLIPKTNEPVDYMELAKKVAFMLTKAQRTEQEERDG